MEKTESKQLVRDLIDGSRAVDRMRNEINIAVGIVISFMEKLASLKGSFFEEVCFSSKNYTWSIKYGEYSGGVRLVCEFYKESELYLYYARGSMRINSKNVKTIYDNMHILVKGVVEEFPEVDDSWQYLLDAAEVFRK